MPGGMSPITSYSSRYSASGPAYDRVTSIPSWLPRERTQELEEQYRGTNAAYDTSAYNQSNEAQQSRVLTTALSAGNNAAAEYANRARQSGGSALGAGLVKAQAATGARAVAGQMELDKQKFNAEQRDKAATHATAIATTLGNLRDSYLKTIVGYATASDSTNASYDIERRKLAQSAENTRRTTSSGLPFTVGSGLGRDSSDFTFGNEYEMQRYSDNNPFGSPYLSLGGYGG